MNTCKYMFYTFALLRVVIIHFYNVQMKSFKRLKTLLILTINVIFCIVREAWIVHFCN
jgi:hypothetical protein